ncbi:MAG: TOBE domain-containing protein, partial [Desulfofustis sp.]|nr:TOBE domain-containing protein [Desulfofustis sp.]
NDSGETFHIPVKKAAQIEAGREAIMGIRPENITDTNEVLRGRQQIATVACKVKVTEPTGPDTLVHVQLNDIEVICRSSPAYAGTPEQQMELALDTSKILFFDPQTEQRIDR